MYPIVEIKLNQIIENAKAMKKICEKNNKIYCLITKVLSDNKEVVKAITDNGITCIGESRIENLISYKDIKVEKWLIRIPMICEVEDVIKYSDVSLNSELVTLKALNEAAIKQNKIHKVILMYELGDLREGCSKQELEEVIKESLKLSNIKIYGLGANLSCYGATIPTKENMKELVDVAEELERKFNIKFELISGGNSSSYKMLKNGELPDRVNNLRLGESVFLGNVPCFEEPILEFNRNNFILKTQIIELKEKTSVPRGKHYVDSFGHIPTFIDRGIRKKAIIALGKQDVRLDCLIPQDNDIIVLGGSSDHVILDVTDCKQEYKVGDEVSFKLNYGGLLNIMTSKYVERKII